MAGRSTTCRRCGCIGSVGEPINPEAWVWYYRFIGGERCPVVDTWWQTETGAIMITPLPGVTTTQARVGDASVSRHRRGDPEREGREGGGRRRPPRAHASVAVDAARHLRRSRALRHAVLEQVGTGRLRHRRRREARRRRQLLAARPRRRRDQRGRPSHRHDGSRERARRSSQRRRSRGRRPRPRDQGPGDRRVRHAEGRHAGHRRITPTS